MKCPHCDSVTYAIKEFVPQGARFKYNMVQCASCGAPAGVVNFTNVAAGIEDLEKLLIKIAKKLGVSV